jgi:hypothetical protein
MLVCFTVFQLHQLKLACGTHHDPRLKIWVPALHQITLLLFFLAVCLRLQSPDCIIVQTFKHSALQSVLLLVHADLQGYLILAWLVALHLYLSLSINQTFFQTKQSYVDNLAGKWCFFFLQCGPYFRTFISKGTLSKHQYICSSNSNRRW